MSALKSKPKKENIDLTILKVFLTYPSIFRHYADVALLTLNEGKTRTIHRALERLYKAELLKKYRISSYLNAELINSLYGKKTIIRENLSASTEYSTDRSVGLELQLVKHFVSDSSGLWTVTELALLLARPSATIQHNLNMLVEHGLVMRNAVDNLKSKTNPVAYKLHPTFAMNLSSDKPKILKTIQETITQ
ncbi:MarR family transcriptional regulator [Leptospira interrogans]|uniref:MarR family transcriptional regulator n=1 Tax=Leptospira interrogans TaxID=173 RepID=A0AAV9FSN8_LEPIR|nr:MULTISPECIES: MarR family transcriptional regulator [Leptospira]KAK2618624.1 MarR family transcriptional regulator [Leptospira interrogans]KAK2618955.1 MarR family transcriptional regulator [Leptospira interrogans]